MAAFADSCDYTQESNSFQKKCDLGLQQTGLGLQQPFLTAGEEQNE